MTTGSSAGSTANSRSRRFDVGVLVGIEPRVRDAAAQQELADAAPSRARTASR